MRHIYSHNHLTRIVVVVVAVDRGALQLTHKYSMFDNYDKYDNNNKIGGLAFCIFKNSFFVLALYN